MRVLDTPILEPHPASYGNMDPVETNVEIGLGVGHSSMVDNV